MSPMLQTTGDDESDRTRCSILSTLCLSFMLVCFYYSKPPRNIETTVQTV